LPVPFQEFAGMSMMWIKDNAKWAILVIGILILVGLLMMDRAGSMGGAMSPDQVVAKVDGEKIDIESFQRDLQNYLRNEEARTGQIPTSLQQAQMREGLLQYKIQSLLLNKVFEKYRLYASVEEMQDFLRKNPSQLAGAIQQYEGPDAVPVFLRDSVLDSTHYLNWLAQDSIYDRPAVRMLEAQLKSVIVPQTQLQALLRSQLHRTSLEETYTTEVRETSARLKFYQVAFDSMKVDRSKFTDADLRKYFDAQPDSFHFRDVATQMRFVRLPIKPSSRDTALMVEFGKELKQRAMTGEKFDELAKAYSNDPGSAEQGGRLGGFQPRSSWVPTFGDAAFSLDSGAISEPILSDFGVHIILSHGQKTEDSIAKADVSHILLKITAGTETIDSLTELANKLRETAMKEKSLVGVAKTYNLTIDSTPIFEKGNISPMGSNYVSGLSSFAFSPFEKDAYSEALQNDEGIYVFERGPTFAKGRDFNRAKERIRELLTAEAKMAEAKKALESQLTAIKSQSDSSMASRMGQAALDSSALVSADNWVSGFGYASPSLFTAFKQADNVWGQIILSDMAAIVAKVVERKAPTTVELEMKARQAAQSPDSYLVSALLQDYLASLPKAYKVDNRLDQIYRN
jgi:peptidyl-prolyl cis-trans isomerase D